MADDEKERQEKLAAAKKRVEEMKKKKNKKGKKAKEEPKEEVKEEAVEAPTATTEAREPTDEKTTDLSEETAAETPKTEESGNEASQDTEAVEEGKPDETSELPSLATQSKLRSTSFRAGAGPLSPGILSPDGDTAPDIYRKHVARIEELEKEKDKLAQDAAESEKRWKKAEEELADLREADGDTIAGGDESLVCHRSLLMLFDAAQLTQAQKSEIASLKRQLQQQTRAPHRQSVSMASPPNDMKAELDSKTSTIESMEIELAKLRARVERQEDGAASEKEQITALEDKVGRAEAAAGKAQRELSDVKKNLERATEKAVREGSERSSAETKISTLEHELAQLKEAKSELDAKADGWEKKAATLTTLHKEQDSRSQALRKDKERLEKEVEDLKAKIDQLESENAKLQKKINSEGGGGLDDEGVDELENEERVKLQKHIRTLEAENHELRSNSWINQRREMEATSPGFQDVDLTTTQHPAQRKHSVSHAGSGLGGFFSNAVNTFAGTAGDADDDLMDDDFDEEAFEKAQEEQRKAVEEEGKRRIERVKDIKRSLKHWQGWRLDLVDLRRGGGQGIGDIFDI